MTTRLRYLPLRCTDLDRAAAFYNDVLGLETTQRRPDEFIQLDVGGAELCVDLAHDEAATPAAILAVDDLAELIDRLADHGSTPDDGSLDKGWVQITDPDGNHLVFEAASRPADPSTNPTG